jgi:hypothetical protein
LSDGTWNRLVGEPFGRKSLARTRRDPRELVIVASAKRRKKQDEDSFQMNNHAFSDWFVIYIKDQGLLVMEKVK